MSSAISYRRLRAPAEHGTALIEPPHAAASNILRDNHATSELDAINFQGKSLGQLRHIARDELVRSAAAYTRAYRDVGLPSGPAMLLLAGHQPELFHPGVWLKNFVLSSLAVECQAVAVNLLIDSHPVGKTEIVVPSGNACEVRPVRISFDRDQAPIAYEQRQCIDRDMFDHFGERVTRSIRPLIVEPLVERHWPLASQALTETNNLGQAIARFRHQIEQRCGLTTLELPLSAVCDTVPFWWLASHLLRHAPRFTDSYNMALAEYRLAHRTRSPSQPLPDLRVNHDWYESPFWIWSDSQPTRRPLFARQLVEEVELSNRLGFHHRLPLSLNGSAERAVENWSSLRQRGWKLRPRALTTTLFARLVLGDLFVHGIGGANYDQVTDRLMELFWGIAPPGFLTVSATVMLPVKRANVSPDALPRIQSQLRELCFHPENYLGDDKSRAAIEDVREATRWVKYKRDWVARELPRGSRRERHEAIQRANVHLRNFVTQQREMLEAERAVLTAQWRNDCVIASREYAFCLFPEDFLCRLLLDLCR